MEGFTALTCDNLEGSIERCTTIRCCVCDKFDFFIGLGRASFGSVVRLSAVSVAGRWALA